MDQQLHALQELTELIGAQRRLTVGEAAEWFVAAGYCREWDGARPLLWDSAVWDRGMEPAGIVWAYGGSAGGSGRPLALTTRAQATLDSLPGSLR